MPGSSTNFALTMQLKNQDLSVLEQLYYAGRFSELEKCAIDMTSQHPELGLGWSILGAALMGQGKDALNAFARAAQLLPQDALAQLQHADALFDSGRIEDAVSAYKLAIDLQPIWPATHNNLGNAFKALGLLINARREYEAALECDSRFALAHYNLAVLNRDEGKLGFVEQHLRNALEANPSLAVAWVELAGVWKEQGELAKAEDALVKAIALSPDLLQARLNLSGVFRVQGQTAKAENELRELLRIDPKHADALAQLGTVLFEQNRLHEAKQMLQLALEVDPLHPAALSSMADVAAAFGDIPMAIDITKQSVESGLAPWETWSKLLFYMASDSRGIDPLILDYHKRFGLELESRIVKLPEKTPQLGETGRTLRVGFVSGDFRDHIVSEWIAPVLEKLKGRSDLRLLAYYTHPVNDEYTLKLRSYFNDWQSVVGMNALVLAEKIQRDSVDILIDLSGHTGYNALPVFAYKPAPVQASWLGYALTTGLTTIDYYLAEENWLPPSQFDRWFTEKLIYLPPYSHVSDGRNLPDVDELPFFVNGHITFGSFNHFRKLSPTVIKTWSRALAEVPHSRMLIGAISARQEQEVILGWFRAQGIGADRLEFAARCDRDSFLRLFNRVDICLDSFPYPGATTNSYALWMGVPTVTLVGLSPMERVGANLLSSLGLDGFIVTSGDQFVKSAIEWASSPDRLANVRHGLRARLQNSSVASPSLLADGLHFAIRKMWQTYCTGRMPTSFSCMGKSSLS